VEHKNGDLGAVVAAKVAQVRQIFTKADAFYRYDREALLNREHHRKELKPTGWIPISEHE
jgi:hypothetical protein